MLLTALVALIVALAAIIGYDLSAYHRVLVSDMATQAEVIRSSDQIACKTP